MLRANRLTTRGAPGGRTVVLVAMGLTAMAAGRARAQSVRISVDATAPGAPIERVWAYHGFDEVNDAVSAEGRALLGTLGQLDPAPPYVRMHFLLNTGNGTAALKWGSTNVYTEDAAGNAVYSWAITDQIMDAVTGAGALSFTEIAFTPEALSPHPTPYQNSGTYTLDSGSFYPPKDDGKWADLVRTWAGHLDGRYPNVPQSWLWELWNEPDIGYFHGTLADYEKLYDVTEAALHQAMPAARLGGPAVANPQGSFLRSFLQHCAAGTNAATGKTGTRLDLVTFHAKGGAAVVNGHVELDVGHQLSLHQSGFSAVAAIPAFKQLPIYVSEADPDGCAACPATTTPSNAYRLSPAYGAYVIEMSKRTLELEASLGVKVGGLITWAFTFPGTPYFAGYRALATNGIDLPVLGAFRLLGGLRGSRLPVSSTGAASLSAILASSVRGAADVDGMATLDGDRVHVLAWNYHDDLVTAPAATVQVQVQLPAAFGSSASVTHLRVDDQNGDADTVWKSLGSPPAPTAAQIQALKAAMTPVSLPPQTVPVSGGIATVSFSLPRFGMSLLTLSPAVPTSDAGTPAGPGGAGGMGFAGSPSPGAGGLAGSGSAGTGGSTSGGAGGTAGAGTGTGGIAAGGSGGTPAGAPPSAQSGQSGCACAVAARRPGQALGLAATGVLVLLARRRRRARP